jgi:hypothetical protein
VLYFSAAKSVDAETTENQDPEYIYKLVDAALKAGLALNTILELTPDQIVLIIGDRDIVAAAHDGKLHFRDQAEFNAWYEARQKE